MKSLYRSGRLALCSAQPAVAKTLRITGGDTIIPLYDQAPAAISWLKEAWSKICTNQMDD